ncbi:MAG: pyrroline-5-carboxylate reductase, partial [Betaproteobacteria bacterium]|nr:pyrroline-5-carboxylate reductase [Betaproteobacteria bacterium]
KGGTTYAALTVMKDKDLHGIVVQAMHAARDRAESLGHELGG